MNAYQIACNYFDNLIIKENLASGRAIDSKQYPESLYTLEIFDDDDNVFLFSDLNEEDKDKFYCSSLVFRAWYEVDHLVNLNWSNIYVSPGDIYGSNSSKLIESYSNY